MTTRLIARGLVEVYPHPALIELTGACERLPYKASKRARYWRRFGEPDPCGRLLEVWGAIVDALDFELDGVAAMLPVPAEWRAGMKAFEDKLDAVICAWVGVCILQGRAKPLGDEGAAIWVPTQEAG